MTEKQKISSIAGSIRRYLSSRPDASETLEGVANWWLLQQRYNDSLEEVKCALGVLEKQGVVTKYVSSDGTEIYKSSL